MAGRTSVVVAATLAALVAGCAAQEDGVASLTTDDLEIVVDGFGDQTTLMSGRLQVQSSGCVAVLIDGTARLPFWPSGTTEMNVSVDPDVYEVRLPGGTVLQADGSGGDHFTAQMTVHEDQEVPMATADGTDYEKIAIIASFCDLEGPAVLIPDAGTVTVAP
ncbi:hypothetical protein [Demequina activiva]|uniref:Lipoprotein n=1 Tax=Demequina activiva TaxID=1582364 RepID=A0A919UGV7_9MICO|nr:hypothetical protein [Demequina activiva]GIG55242.1 hypothetical protein Dac01nite_19940 [Demequina activiva]